MPFGPTFSANIQVNGPVPAPMSATASPGRRSTAWTICLPLGEDFPRIRLEPLNKPLNVEVRVLELSVQIGRGVVLVVLLT